MAAGILATGCTEAEAKTRAGLIDVGSYAVFLDLTTDPGTVHWYERTLGVACPYRKYQQAILRQILAARSRSHALTTA